MLIFGFAVLVCGGFALTYYLTERGCNVSKPASAKPVASAMALTSVRPMRPPAPATIKRISAIGYCKLLASDIARQVRKGD
jgi:hypothetical protein